MADQASHINYSLDDIKRYLEGGMSAKEMHDLEKAALQDPFLADAIEGYSGASMEQSYRHLEEITATLQPGKSEAKVVSIPSKNLSWLRIAAIFILLAGVGTVTWYFIAPDKTTNYAAGVQQEKSAAKQFTDTNAQPAIKDTNYSFTDNLPAKRNSARAKDDSRKIYNKEIHIQPDKRENESRFSYKKIIADSDEQVVSSKLAKEITASKADVASKANIQPAPVMDSTLKDFKGHVVDENNQPVVNAIINAGDRHVTATDASGYFIVKAPDSLLNVSVSSIGYTTVNAQLRNNTSNNISIAPNKEAYSESVVTAYSANKNLLERKINVDNAYPLGGWESFKEYVHQKTGTMQDTLNSKGITKNVEIEFSIDDKGTPYGFKIMSSPGDSTTSKAIAIIKGAKWIATKKNQKGKVTIQF